MNTFNTLERFNNGKKVVVRQSSGAFHFIVKPYANLDFFLPGAWR